MPAAETPLLPLPPDWRRLPDVGRGPQSPQSSPKEHQLYSDPGPPSSQEPSLAIQHLFVHAVAGAPRSICSTTCRANALTPASCPRIEPLRSSTRTRFSSKSHVGARGGRAGGIGGGGENGGLSGGGGIGGSGGGVRGGGGDGRGGDGSGGLGTGGGGGGDGETSGGAGERRSHTREKRCAMSTISVP